MPTVPVNVEWFLRASRDFAACLGGLQNPDSTPVSRDIMGNKAFATQHVMMDAASDMPGNLSVLEAEGHFDGDIETARRDLLGLSYSRLVLRAVQRAGRIRAEAVSLPLYDFVGAQADSWRARAREVHEYSPAGRSAAISALRRDREACVSGITLVSAASTATTSEERDSLLRLARATLVLRRDG
jgi:hypothetical protein